ncbi:MAG TPA: hypothetical protein VGH44_04325 [Candidatus Saccharimonadia bacterium]|jgi:hypothetical protein
MSNPSGTACRFDPLSDGTVPAGEVLATVTGSDGGYLIQAGRFVDGELVLEAGHYLAFPNRHVPRTGDVPGWSDVMETLLDYIPEFHGLKSGNRPDHSTYELHGAAMGRTVPGHGHTHILIGTAADMATKFAAVQIKA